MNALDRPVSMRAMAVLRIWMGPVVLLYLRPFLSDAADGRIYRDMFHEPYASWYPELSRGTYEVFLWVLAGLAVTMMVGLATKVSTVAVVVGVVYHQFLTTTHAHHNRAYLMIVLAGLAICPCGRELSLDRWWRHRRGRPALPTDAPAWTLLLLRFEASVVYGASGFSKLIDPDWFGGTVTYWRTVHGRDDMEASGLPGWLIDVFTNRDVHTVSAKVIVATELFIAVGFWFRPTRLAAVWLAVIFHLSIESSARVQTFSILAIGALMMWAVPSTRDRRLTVPARWSGPVRALDWLGRFELRIGTEPILVVDRDGTTRDGARAWALVLSRLPLTSMLGLTWLAVLRVTRLGRRPERDVSVAAS